ncbi:hypothetical protein HMPREF0973_02452 [Prevotella veroralis F0319]|uniref:Uncharacterized protein n=1 Tax=Prevotella veroralis F0319 TaxID=649761 RepID=C9MS39_9BACT|nr:hypothetical protein HMPREF0973_02452 [Prevotella veroralis F0319]
MGIFFLFFILYKYLIKEVLHVNKDFSFLKTSFNSVSKSIVSIINVVAEKLFKEQYSLITNDLLRFTQ